MRILTENFSWIGWPWRSYKESKSRVLWQIICAGITIWNKTGWPTTLGDPEKRWKTLEKKLPPEKFLESTWNSLEIAKIPREKKNRNWNLRYLLTSQFNEVLYLSSLNYPNCTWFSYVLEIFLKNSVLSWMYLNFSWIFSYFLKNIICFRPSLVISFFRATLEVWNNVVFSSLAFIYFALLDEH